MIGKSRKPRYFRGCQTLPCTYDSNAIAWMTRKIFEAWIKKCDNKFRKAKRSVAFIVDNCTAHPTDITLTNTEHIFLPPNVTSLIQPCNQGIIKTLKAHYRKGIIERMVAATDAGSSANAIEFSKFDLLDAMNTIVASWSEITTKIITVSAMQVSYPNPMTINVCGKMMAFRWFNCWRLYVA